jgi:hypothetical protein
MIPFKPEITKPVHVPVITYNNTLIPKSKVCLVYFCVGFNKTNVQAFLNTTKFSNGKHNKIII